MVYSLYEEFFKLMGQKFQNINKCKEIKSCFGNMIYIYEIFNKLWYSFVTNILCWIVLFKKKFYETYSNVESVLICENAFKIEENIWIYYVNKSL